MHRHNDIASSSWSQLDSTIENVQLQYTEDSANEDEENDETGDQDDGYRIDIEHVEVEDYEAQFLNEFKYGLSKKNMPNGNNRHARGTSGRYNV